MCRKTATSIHPRSTLLDRAPDGPARETATQTLPVDATVPYRDDEKRNVVRENEFAGVCDETNPTWDTDPRNHYYR